MSRRCLALVCGALCGCGMFRQHGLPDDPLFAQRKPIESKAVQTAPQPPAHAEPLPPPNPYHTSP